MPYPDTFTDAQIAEIKRRVRDDDGCVLDSPVGESVYDRAVVTNTSAPTSGQMQLAGFTARATQNISQVRVVSGNTAAGATPSICRFGVYQRSTDGLNNYTLIASTVNDTAVFASANTTYTRSFSASWLKTAGTDYMVGTLVVSAAAMPTFAGPLAANLAGYAADVAAAFPQVMGRLLGQSDLPASFLASALSTPTIAPHVLLLQ